MNHHDHHARVDDAELHVGHGASTVPSVSRATGSGDVPGRSTTSTHRPGLRAALWNAITALIATMAGIAPHVLHHIGLFAGAFLITGAAGNLLFGALGLVLSIPLLRRLYRRFGTWRAPAIAVGVFALMFSVSTFVIGPAISQDGQPPTPVPGQGVSPQEHPEHHG